MFGRRNGRHFTHLQKADFDTGDRKIPNKTTDRRVSVKAASPETTTLNRKVLECTNAVL
jgi:hypothetical protein